MTRRGRLAGAMLTAILLSSVAASGATAHSGGGSGWDLLRAAVATARFHSTDRATKAGYGPFPDGVPLHSCIASLDGTGAMGFHWLDPDNLTTTLDPTKPQVLVYAPDRHGRLQLVALEYVVFQDAWFKDHGDTTPMLFGQMFMKTGDRQHPEIPNRYEIPPFWALHVWLWKANPSGLFAPFNPNVSCDPGTKSASRGAGVTAVASSLTGVRFGCDIASPTAALVPTRRT
jgi:hypothetical protein